MYNTYIRKYIIMVRSQWKQLLVLRLRARNKKDSLILGPIKNDKTPYF